MKKIVLIMNVIMLFLENINELEAMEIIETYPNGKPKIMMQGYWKNNGGSYSDVDGVKAYWKQTYDEQGKLISEEYFKMFDEDGNVIPRDYYENCGRTMEACSGKIREGRPKYDDHGRPLRRDVYNCSDISCNKTHETVYQYDSNGGYISKGYTCTNGICIQTSETIEEFDDNGEDIYYQRSYACEKGECRKISEENCYWDDWYEEYDCGLCGYAGSFNCEQDEIIPDSHKTNDDFCSSDCNTCNSQKFCTKCNGENFHLNDGYCDRIRYTPAEAAEVLTDDNNNSVTITFKM